MLRLLFVVTAALARPPRSPLASSRPRALASTPATTTLHRVHAALRAWLDGPRDDARSASALCAARARALARAARAGERATLEAALAVAFDLTTSDRAALPPSCARERRYDGLADLTNLATVLPDGAPPDGAPPGHEVVTTTLRLVGDALLDDGGGRGATAFADVVAVGMRRRARSARDTPIYGFVLADGPFVLAESPLRCLAEREARERAHEIGDGCDGREPLLCSDGIALACFADADAADARALAMTLAAQQSAPPRDRRALTAWAGEDPFSTRLRGTVSALVIGICMTDERVGPCNSTFDAAFGNIGDDEDVYRGVPLGDHGGARVYFDASMQAVHNLTFDGSWG